MLANQQAVLEAFAKCGNLTQAAEAAGVHRSLPYQWLDNDATRYAVARDAGDGDSQIDGLDATDSDRGAPSTQLDSRQNVPPFRARLALAERAYGDSLLRLMHERLHDPQGNRGSDVLLMFDIKAHHPKYRDERAPDQEAADIVRELREIRARRRAELEAPSVRVEPPQEVGQP